ncbi:unnamed protein product, partial [Clonostachys rhizophaga]
MPQAPAKTPRLMEPAMSMWILHSIRLVNEAYRKPTTMGQEPVHIEIGRRTLYGDFVSAIGSDSEQQEGERCLGEASSHGGYCLSDGRVWNDFGYGFNIIYLAFKSKDIYHATTEPVKRGNCQQRIVGTEAGVGLFKFSQRTKNI